METIPKRRGRRPMNNPPAETPASQTAEAAPTARRRRKAVGGFHMKLAAPSREGFFRRWFVDKPGRLAEAEELAYDFVRDTSIKTDGTDSRVRRLTGTDSYGAPQYSYLMETPVEEYQAGADDKERARAPFEDALRRGEDPLQKLDDSYGKGEVAVSNRA